MTDVEEAAKALKGDTSEPEAPTLNAVVIHRSYNETGDLSVDVQAIGDVRPTETPAIIEIGLKVIRQKLGLAP